MLCSCFRGKMPGCGSAVMKQMHRTSEQHTCIDDVCCAGCTVTLLYCPVTNTLCVGVLEKCSSTSSLHLSSRTGLPVFVSLDSHASRTCRHGNLVYSSITDCNSDLLGSFRYKFTLLNDNMRPSLNEVWKLTELAEHSRRVTLLMRLNKSKWEAIINWKSIHWQAE